MEPGILKIIQRRPASQNVKMLFATRAYSNLPDLRNKEEKSALSRFYPNLAPQYWNERTALKNQRKEHGLSRSVTSVVDFIKVMQDLRNFPRSFSEIYEFIKRRRNRRNLIDQKFLARRELVLKPDLAAAHFIVQRGGSVKFLGHAQWVGIREQKQSLPITYVPGVCVEAIRAEGTSLCYEGLQNLRKLQHINYLSLRDLDDINDWCLDWVSSEFYATLKHLDLSNCKNVTYRGLSCFYRFECLKILNLEGVPDPPEMKLACLMLLEIMPNLDIKGIDLSIPDKIDAVNLGETKHLSEETKSISENDKLEVARQVSKM